MDFYQVANNVFDYVQQHPFAQYSLIVIFVVMLIRYRWFRWVTLLTILLPLGILWFMVRHDNVNSIYHINNSKDEE